MLDQSGVFTVEVQVALARPPRADATVWVTVDAPSDGAAIALACQLAEATRPRVVMAVKATILSVTI